MADKKLESRSLEDICTELLKKDTRYMVGISIKKGDVIEHHFLSRDFPIEDMFNSHFHIERSIREHIQKFMPNNMQGQG